MAERPQPLAESRSESGERVVLVSAGLGAAASFAGVVASWWALAGETPAFIFARFETLRPWRSGEIILGLPLEFWGLLWFATLAGLAVQSRPRWPRVWTWSLLLSGICLIAIAGGGAWNARLTNWPLNVATIAGIGVLAGASLSVERPSHGVSFRSASPIRSFCFLLAITAIGSGGYMMRARLQAVTARTAAERNFLRWFNDAWNRSPQPSSSAVTVEVFNDYQCPFCAIAVPRIRALVEQHRAEAARQVRLLFRDFPLDSTCNPGLALGPHPTACEAAAFARFCALSMAPDARAEAVEWLYAEGPDLTASHIRAFLHERGLANRFEEARHDLLQAITADVVSGLQRGVRATPTVFVNGVRLPNHVYLELALNALSARR